MRLFLKKKSMNFSRGQVAHYNETIWKNLHIFHLGKPPMTIWLFQKSLNFTNRQIVWYNYSISKNLSVFHKYYLFLYKSYLFYSECAFLDNALFSPNHFFLVCFLALAYQIVLFITLSLFFRVHFLALVYRIVCFLALSIFFRVRFLALTY